MKTFSRKAVAGFVCLAWLAPAPVARAQDAHLGDLSLDDLVLHGSAFLAPSAFQAFSHYGSFYSADGGSTYASGFWHLPNPGLKPEKKSTTEVAARYMVGSSVELWGSVFHSRFTDLIREVTDQDDRYAGFYKGWPVDFIEISINQGREQTFGGAAGVDVVRVFGSERKIAWRVALSLADGEIEDKGLNDQLQVGGLAPVQLQTSADLHWGDWSGSPRLSLVGHQRFLATVIAADGLAKRRTLDGYALLDVSIRRHNVFRNLDAFVTIDNALDQRYRSINLRAYNNPEALIGAPQNPRRVTAGFQVRLP